MRLDWGRGLTGLGSALATIAARRDEEQRRAADTARDDARFKQQWDRQADWRAEDIAARNEATLADAVGRGFQPVRPGQYMAPIAGEPVPQVIGSRGFVAAPEAGGIGRALVSVGGQKGVFDPTKSDAAVLARANEERDLEQRKELMRYEADIRPVEHRLVESPTGVYAVDPRNPGTAQPVRNPAGEVITPRLAGGQTLTPLQALNQTREQAEAEIHNKVFSGQGLTRGDLRAVVERYPGALTIEQAEQFARTVAERRLPGSAGGVAKEDGADAFLRQLAEGLGEEEPAPRRGGGLNPWRRGEAMAEDSAPSRQEVVGQLRGGQQQNPAGAGAGQESRPPLEQRMAELKRSGTSFEQAQQILRREGYIQ